MIAPLYKDHRIPDFQTLNQPHSGLWFERFFNGFDEKKDWQIPKPDEKQDVKRDWINHVTGKIGNQKQLDDFHKKQNTLISVFLKGDSRLYKTDWHFVTGMGNPHPVENGFTWHPTLAVPYLAGSAVKGLIRAWVEMNDDVDDKLSEEQKKSRLKHWFGTEDKEQVAEQTGNFIFFDALPSEPPQLICDIMTPHMGKWYEQGDTGSLSPDVIPADWHEPVPVSFLAVKSAQFIFSIAARTPNNENHVKELSKIFEALDKALMWLGAGAKTATGYGYMEETNQSKQRREERAQQQKKEARESQLASLSEAQKALVLLREAVEKDPKPALQGPLRELLTKTIKQAETENWLIADKHELLEIGNSLNNVWKADKLKKQLKTLQ